MSCTKKKRGGSQPPKLGDRSDDLALVGGPDDPGSVANGGKKVNEG